MLEELLMAELLCTRLCHDLTGPIGAVNNGAEFLSEEGFNMQGQAVDLIVSSAQAAVTRLQFYRKAYGKVRDHGEADLSAEQKLAADFFADGKTTLDWPDSHTEAANVSVSVKMGRILINMLIIGSSALIRGGTLSVRIGQDDKGHKQVTVSATGANLKWDPENDVVFSGKLAREDLSPKNVQTYLTKRFIDELGSEFNRTVEGDTLVMQVSQTG